MADDSVVRPARRIIKIKFGNTVVSSQAVRVTGLGSSASQDSKDVKSGSALHLAKLRQASLKGYVPPSATAEAIVARLREGEGFVPGCELPAWDFTAPSPKECNERPSKRLRQLTVVDGGCLEPSNSALGAQDPVGVRSRNAAPVFLSRRSEPVQQPKPSAAKPGPPTDLPGVVVGCGESNSDQATTSQAYLPLSPDDVADGSGRIAVGAALQPHTSGGRQSSLASHALTNSQQPQRAPAVSAAVSIAAAASSAAAVAKPERGPGAVSKILPARPAGSCPPGAAARTEALPSTSDRQQLPSSPAAVQQGPLGVSVETQTSQCDFPVLPTSFLELSRLSGAALSYQSIGPFDLQLEKDQRPSIPVGNVDTHIGDASRIKREGDALFNKNAKVWTIKSLSKYVTAALMFMEAAEALVRERSSERLKRAANLYKQTGNLLDFTQKYADGMPIVRTNGIGKEALRLLAERLSAVCLLRQATLLANSFRTCADRAQAALRDHQRQQAAQGQGTAGSAGGGPQPSPEDSSTSSLPAGRAPSAAQAGGGTGAPGAQAALGTPAAAPQALPGFGHEQVAELVGYTRITWRFAESMKRSSKSFEAFLERADVRQDQQAKLVCVHLAAVCMDLGMAPGARVIHHAREALRTMCEDLAR